MSIFNLISLFGGLALFLYGMRVMGDGLKQCSSGTLNKAMATFVGNPFMGFLLGFVVTGIIQSSHATIVLTSGLVGAGIITLHQSIGIIIGANLGTTITGQIIRLIDLKGGASTFIQIFQPSTLAPVAAIVGIIFIMVSKKKNSDLIGTILLGFGILFTGLLNMTGAVAPLSSSETFTNIFASLGDKPVIGYIVGALTAAVLQSSSATIGILQALSVTGKLTFGSIYSIIVGIYLGDCLTTAVICTLGSANADAKRTGVIHVLYGICKSVIVLLIVNIVFRLGLINDFWNSPISSGGIANVHTLFNLVCAALLLPVCGIFERESKVIIKDTATDETEADRVISALSPALFSSPEMALSTASNAIKFMGEVAKDNLERSFDIVDKFSDRLVTDISTHERELDRLADNISDYLVKLSTHTAPGHETDRLNYYIKCVSEFERVGDLAVNICENAESMNEKKTVFSSYALHELSVLRSCLEEVINYTIRAFDEESSLYASYIEPIEEVVDDLIEKIKSNHFARVQNGECNYYTGYVILDILTNLERVSDQCANIGVHTLALNDANIADKEHDYIKMLHQGGSEEFNAKYKEYRAKYYDEIEEVKENK